MGSEHTGVEPVRVLLVEDDSGAAMLIGQGLHERWGHGLAGVLMWIFAVIVVSWRGPRF